jgi:hypothetical protein
MSAFDDMCALLYKKESRMEWARKFIVAWLDDPQLQFISHSLDALTSVANDWIPNSVDISHIYPTVSSLDVREAALEALDSNEMANEKPNREIVRLDAIVRSSKA